MFNPLSLLKKKSAKNPDEATQAAAKETQFLIDNIVVHTMPERFRQATTNAKSSKTTGILIMIGGAVFLIAVSIGLYFYLYKEPVNVVTEESTASSSPVERAPEAVPAETRPEEIPGAELNNEPGLPFDNNLATSTATSTPGFNNEIIEPEPPLGLVPSVDGDNDGLTDAEEILLKTSTSTPDTDQDGYLDGAELLNLYDPATSTAKLIANPNIAVYENKTFNYTALYPRLWQISNNGGDDSIMFKSEYNQFFQIIVQSNVSKRPLDEWYMEQLDVVEISAGDRLSGLNWQGIKNLDGLTIYLMDAQEDYIYTLSYIPGENNILDYINIFNMMVKSFTLNP